MSAVAPHSDDLNVQLARWVEGDLEERQSAELFERIAGDEALQRDYLHFMFCQAMLDRELRRARSVQQLMDLQDAQPSPGRLARAWRFAYERISHPMALSLLVSGLFVTVILLSLALWTLPGDRGLTWPGTERERIVGDMVRTSETQWAAGSLENGRPPIDLLVGQPFELAAGPVTLRFESGARVLIEGPARFIVQGPQRLVLEQGQLAAHMPPPAAGFLVRTPTVDVVDLGTDFSVRAASAETEVQVLQGKVEVRRAGHGSRGKVSVLTTDQAALFGEDSENNFYVQETEMNRTMLLSMMTLLATAAPTQAATITWGTPTAISSVGDSIVETNGTLVNAVNFSSGPALRTVNTVPFTAQTTAVSGWETPVHDFSIYQDGNVGGDFQLILDTFMYGSAPSASGSVETLTLSGLTTGNPYLVQFFVSDDRTGSETHLRTQNFTGGANTSDTVANGLSYSLVGTFFAEGSTQLIEITGLPGGSAAGNPILNAYQLRALPVQPVPEPGAAAMLLLGGGLLGGCCWGRRIRASRVSR